jgi:rod shape-determining protein MreC
VKSGDLRVTSGLGGVFPEGYPVARVTEVHRDAVQPLAQVRAAPLAHVDTDTEVMLVWFREDHPAAPAAAVNASGELSRGNPAMQPQAAPPKPTPAATPAAAAAPDGDSDDEPVPQGAPPEVAPEEGAPAETRPAAPAKPAPKPKGKPQPRKQGTGR